jgi:adenosine deaminase
VTATSARAALHRLPKAELHCHLDGSLRPGTLLALARERGVALPREDADTLADYMVVSDARNLQDYLDRFEVTLSVMQDEAAIRRIARELVEDAAADGVRYVEVRYAPFLSTRQGLTDDAVMAAWVDGMADGERATGTVARAIVCALRHRPLSDAMAMAELAVAWRGRGVVAFDLAGAEAPFPASQFAEAFAYARRHDLAVTCHAGEAAGAESVREAVHACGADRIGHGTRLVEDAALLDYVTDRRVHVEICLTSNVQTRAVPTASAHPLAAYVARGVSCSLATDNTMMSGVSLTDEYVRAHEECGLSLAALCDVAAEGFRAAFLPWQERQAMLARLAPEFDAVRRIAATAA